ncbi:MAG: HesA/MoeB/ThiF family protein [Methanobrevibacter sp.]|uniref:HesA/MoeB/ThiF family protein n=1 Tax=Methanobrevibacter sp. TaxID=66852 RepID=UPI0025CDF3AF|nr:HesA/MoeB/ThiF family protein [Methanobrevibacter sp.]MBE6509442.1 HesA/MoeB/ThiF family protein [Methanobrevibacter sp.]
MSKEYDDESYWQIATRQMSIVTTEEQEKFRNGKITVIGCGGIGGQTIELLARMGIGELVLVDEDVFDMTNINRQSLSSTDTIGLKKSEVACKRVESINPHVKVTGFDVHVDETNIDEIIGDSNLVIDALDNLLTRVIVSRKAIEKRIPYVHGAIHGTLGQVSVFLPNTKSYEEMFNLPSLGKELTEEVIGELESLASGKPPVIGPAPNMISCLEAMEAFKILTGIGKVTVAPKILTFDLLDFNSFSVEEI